MNGIFDFCWIIISQFFILPIKKGYCISESFSKFGYVFHNTEICPDDISYIGIIFRIHPSLSMDLSALKSCLTIWFKSIYPEKIQWMI